MNDIKRLAYKFEEARYLLGGISLPTLRRYIAEGRIKPIAGTKTISADELERFVQAEEEKGE